MVGDKYSIQFFSSNPTFQCLIRLGLTWAVPEKSVLQLFCWCYSNVHKSIHGETYWHLWKESLYKKQARCLSLGDWLFKQDRNRGRRREKSTHRALDPDEKGTRTDLWDCLPPAMSIAMALHWCYPQAEQGERQSWGYSQSWPAAFSVCPAHMLRELTTILRSPQLPHVPLLPVVACKASEILLRQFLAWSSTKEHVICRQAELRVNADCLQGHCKQPSWFCLPKCRHLSCKCTHLSCSFQVSIITKGDK